MQFLVYLTVLMVSVSTVLLEVHWLTTPAPQPKPAVQASAPPPRPKVEGPNAELSPVYPKKVEPAQPTSPPPQANVDVAAPANTAAAETAPQPAETTGISARSDDSGRSANASPADNEPNAQAHAAPSKQAYAATPKQSDSTGAAVSNNRCDVQACGSTYKSFRASDCTYQPFDGPRRVCEKAPEQRASREQRDEPQRRAFDRRDDARDVDRRTRERVRDEDDDARDIVRRTRWRVYDEDDDDADDVVVFRRGRRW